MPPITFRSAYFVLKLHQCSTLHLRSLSYSAIDENVSIVVQKKGSLPTSGSYLLTDLPIKPKDQTSSHNKFRPSRLLSGLLFPSDPPD